MATSYLEVEIEGTIVKVEIDQESLSGEVPVSGVVSRVRDAMPEVQETIEAVTKMVFSAISSLASKPTEATVEFGINIRAEAGVLVANTSAEAQIKVGLTWK